GAAWRGARSSPSPPSSISQAPRITSASWVSVDAVALSFEFPFYATAALVSGPVLFARGFRTLRTQQLVRDTPTAKIRSMAMGLVEVNGTVVPRSTVIAPFSGKPCAY